MKRKSNNITLKITGMIIGSIFIIIFIGILFYFQINPSTIISVSGDSTINVMPDLSLVKSNFFFC